MWLLSNINSPNRLIKVNQAVLCIDHANPLDLYFGLAIQKKRSPQAADRRHWGLIPD